MTVGEASPRVFGARVKRSEDPRFLRGQGQYVADLQNAGTLHARFVRSPVAHAKVISIDADGARDNPSVVSVFTGADWAEIGITCVSSYAGFKPSTMPVLANGIVRYAGEAVAMILADDEYQAEDAARSVFIDYEPLEAIVSVEDALAPGAGRIHEGWDSNCFVERRFVTKGYQAAVDEAPHTLTHRWDMARHSGVPLECRAVVAAYDAGRDRVTIWTSTQIPHLIKSGLAAALGRSEDGIRVISPDVGGGFGVKAQLYPEEVACARAAIDLNRTVRWVEDRREHFLTAHHSREHTHEATMAYDDDGHILAYGVTVHVNMGPYSVFPWTATMDTGMAMGILPGPYRILEYSALGYPVATNKAPYGAYRGVSRPAACFTTERMLDQVAKERGLDPVEVRRRNLLGQADYPYNSVSGLVYDSGTVRECLDLLIEWTDYADLRSQQQQQRAQGRLVGIGVVPFIEQTAHTSKEFVQRGVPIVFGYETSKLRFTPDGKLVISSSIHSHGQGLETTLAQMAADELGLSLSDIRVEFGDTDQVPYGSGTFASRSAVLAGGAARMASTELHDKLARIAAHLLEASVEDLVFVDGEVAVAGSPSSALSLFELCRIVYQRPEQLPPGEDPTLEATVTYDAAPGTGTYTSAAHMALVEIDPETGHVQVGDYFVVEDCGMMINPTIVEGQITGGVAQGIGSALFEEFIYDDDGQLLTTTMMDYLMPTASDVPPIHIRHLETPSTTVAGVRGMGEGGAIAPGAVIAAAVEDALSAYGDVVVDRLPLSPERVLAYADAAKENRR
ncbi:MAG: xanthine dehydrogenase family protein molybdopterin-binding subunit [Acidimicrobiia bacterium]